MKWRSAYIEIAKDVWTLCSCELGLEVKLHLAIIQFSCSCNQKHPLFFDQSDLHRSPRQESVGFFFNFSMSTIMIIFLYSILAKPSTNYV